MKESKIKELKGMSNYYPMVVTRTSEDDNTEMLYLSTLVRLERSGTWYYVHVVISQRIESIADRNLAWDMIRWEVHKVIHMYKPSDIDSVDTFQISEKERMDKKITSPFDKWEKI